ncbi:uncharacterized protein LOC123970488 [Micropterus dolomieu]|uniref:uncharacterized protein LOC123970488 n=1 Tax=Micropterus dolomieu TaxID=147949 RepID=UPI001E8E35B6|nr:uncharacterized protein LOC123970488 [Micropterus dolomieu]
MERNKKNPLLFLLLALLHVCTTRSQDCCSLPNNNLTCYSDFNRTITCVWNSTYVSDTECTIHAKKVKGRSVYSASCDLKPVDISRPMLKKCSLDFIDDWIFQTKDELSINLNCVPEKQSLEICYKPACHIKLNPPPKPDVNSTAISWFPQVNKHGRITSYISQLQWKREDCSWSDPSVKTENKEWNWSLTVAQIPDSDLLMGERYEARVRVQGRENWAKSTWSDWSPVASWESTVGKTKPTIDGTEVLFGVVAAVLAFAVLLTVAKTDKTTWIYMVKRISGPPLPNPAKSFLQDVNFQNWLSPHFTGESLHSFLKPVEIVSVEITSTVDAVAPCGPEATLLEKMRSKGNHESASSNFSNPSYSQLCPPPPVSSLTAGNLEPCASDTPYGPVSSQGEGKNEVKDRDEVRGKEVEILQLLSKGSNNSEPMPVISDYEKVEKLQVERVRLQSLDSGMCSGEEVSQESLEADSISMTNCHDEGPEDMEERQKGNGEGGFQKLFGGNGFGKSIQVCSDYEPVRNLQNDSLELPSLDSGISSGGEEQMSQEESLEDIDKSTKSTGLLFSPLSPPFRALPCSLTSFAPLPLNFSGPCLSPAQRPLPTHILERIALISTNRLVEPSGDGYTPVRQEES